MSFIKLYRDILDHWVFTDPRSLKIWVWLLASATYRTRHVNVRAGSGTKVITLNPGDLLYGRLKGEEELQIPSTTIYRTLQKFEQEGMITIQSDIFGTRITVCNWASYQSFSDEDGTRTEHVRNTYGTPTEHVRNAHGTRTEPIEERLEGIEGKEGIELGEGTHTRPAPPDETLPAVIQSGPPANTDAETKKGRRGAAVSTTFQKPKISEVVEFMAQHAEAQVMQGRTTGTEVTASAEAEAMFNHFEANGWKVGRNPVKDWKAAARNWYARSLQYARERAGRNNSKTGFGEGIAAARIADQILFPNEKP